MAEKRGWQKKLGWFVLLWACGVAAVLVLGYGIRAIWPWAA